ncbi:MAG TPA: CoA transferase [Dehalococcoidia bacterium]|nr:CoA transferase [Dehalococcoidia bacterium]
MNSSSTAAPVQPLSDVTVLDLTHHIVGPYATKLFGDFGADVIKVEKPDGDIARSLGPFKDDEAHPESSGLFFYLNTNKRSLVLDLKSEAGLSALRQLATGADIVVESFSPETLDRLGCGWEFFQSVNPGLPLVSISNFGQDGPYRHYRVSDLVLYAFAGEMYSMGETDREPTKMAGTAALFESGASAAVATFAALWASKRHGIAQHVDVSLAETHLGGVDRRHATAIGFEFSGRRTMRASGAIRGMPSGIYPCADGYVDFTNAQLHPDRVADMLGHPDWLMNDSRFTDVLQRMNPNTVGDFDTHFLEWCLAQTKREIWSEARRARVMCGPLFTMEDLFNDDHFRDRGFWEEAEHQALGRVTLPGRPFLMSEGGWALKRTAPLLGEHSTELLAEFGVNQETTREILEGRTR